MSGISRTLDLVARIKPVNEMFATSSERDVADDVARIRRHFEPVKRRRQAEKRRHRPTIHADQLQADGEPKIGDKRERMRRIDRQQLSAPEDRLVELRFNNHSQSALRQRRRRRTIRMSSPADIAGTASDALLLHLQVVDLAKDVVELLGRHLAVRAAHDDVLAHPGLRGPPPAP